MLQCCGVMPRDPKFCPTDPKFCPKSAVMLDFPNFPYQRQTLLEAFNVKTNVRSARSITPQHCNMSENGVICTMNSVPKWMEPVGIDVW